MWNATSGNISAMAVCGLVEAPVDERLEALHRAEEPAALVHVPGRGE
jgi:hypothetical protein